LTQKLKHTPQIRYSLSIDLWYTDLVRCKSPPSLQHPWEGSDSLDSEDRLTHSVMASSSMPSSMPFQALHATSKDSKLDAMTEQIYGLLHREFDYIRMASTQSKPVSLPRLHAQWRPSIFEWFYKIIDHFLLERGIVAIAMDYVDRFLLTTSFRQLDNASSFKMEGLRDLDKMPVKTYQLVAMSSLYVAMKLHAGNEPGSEAHPWRTKRKTFCINGFVKLSRGQFIAEDVLSMESLILQTLTWKMNPVTVSCFLDSFMDLFPRPKEILRELTRDGARPKPDILAKHRKHLGVAMHVLHELSRYLVELAICVPGLTPYFETDHSGQYMNQIAPSAISYAAILLALDMMSTSAIPQLARQMFVARVTKAQDSLVCALSSLSAIKYLRYDPRDPEVLELKHLILGSFVPSLVLGPLTGQEGPEGSTPTYHPFKVAKSAGMFNMRYFKNDDAPMISSPTSPLDSSMV